jgi:hypothetical protein
MGTVNFAEVQWAGAAVSGQESRVSGRTLESTLMGGKSDGEVLARKARVFQGLFTDILPSISKFRARAFFILARSQSNGGDSINRRQAAERWGK